MFQRIGFIGGGVMGEAIIRALLTRAVLPASALMASDPLAERRRLLAQTYGIAVTESNLACAAEADLVVLAIKPQHAPEVLHELRGRLESAQTVLSIVAGLTIPTMVAGLQHEAVVRVMPNTPAQIGEGMSVWTATPAVTAPAREGVRRLLQALGREVYVADERYLDMATALSGSGPAYVFLFMEALIDAGVQIGLPRALAEELVLQTTLGAARMAQETGRHLAELRNMVTSPGGTTAAALFAFEEGGLRATLMRGVLRAYERSQELGRGAH
jgi:pyrroline-5-carboxylate reductase